MSSKQETSDAIEDSKPALAPKLRFPEFEEAERWQFLPLNRLAIRAKRKNRDEQIDRVLTNSAEFGVVDQRDFFDKDIATQGKLEGYVVVERDSYVYNPRISSTAPVGPISKNKIGTGVMSPLYTVFKFKDDRNDFYEHFFKTTGWHTYMRLVSSTGARHDRMAISSDDFMAMPLPVSSPAEQQKIADCLSSLDELITAQGRKVDALKTHKKGLMQQLFPREGETQPRLRFPEFQNAGEWVTRRLGDFSDVSASGDLDSATFSRERSEKHCFPVYSNAVENEGIYGFSSVARHQANSVTITARGTLGRAFLRTTGFVGIGRLIVVSNFAAEADSGFLKECWDHLAVIPQEVTSIPQLTAVAARATALPFPSLPEQQRIAACLSNHEDRITAETQKLVALKIHKKGLMQQLFPATAEVEA